jgi:epimerase transport system membrane fusion protein
VRAPAEGTVLALRENTIGAVISPGEDLMEVVPRGKKLIIDTKLSPLDIDRIYMGQNAEVRFAVFKDAYTISGKLVRVSADILDDDETGERYYEGKVELLEDDLKLLGENQLVPGMPAEVLIKTGNRTLLGYLTSPLARMFETSLIED